MVLIINIYCIILSYTGKQIFYLIKNFSMFNIGNLNNSDNSETQLSGREKQVIKLVTVGLANKEIACKLDISKHTVDTHCKNIYRKLGVKNRYDASEIAAEIGIVKLP